MTETLEIQMVINVFRCTRKISTPYVQETFRKPLSTKRISVEAKGEIFRKLVFEKAIYQR